VESEDVVASACVGTTTVSTCTLRRVLGTARLPMPKSWPRYPAREQVVGTGALQEHLHPPHFGEMVHRVELVDGTWETTTARGLGSDNVVIATGRARVPVRPTWPGPSSTEATFFIPATTAMETRGKVSPSSSSGLGTRRANRHWISSNEEPRSISPCVHRSTSCLGHLRRRAVLPLGIVMRRPTDTRRGRIGLADDPDTVAM